MRWHTKRYSIARNCWKIVEVGEKSQMRGFAGQRRPKISREEEQLRAERVHSVLWTGKICSRPKRGLFTLANETEKRDERMKGAGGQSRESRDDIGIGSVRRLGERGTANDKVPAWHLLSRHETLPPVASSHSHPKHGHVVCSTLGATSTPTPLVAASNSLPSTPQRISRYHDASASEQRVRPQPLDSP